MAEDFDFGSLDKHGNPNVLTLDKGTSKLAQCSVAQTALVEVERFVGEAPAITVFAPPAKASFSTELLKCVVE